MPTALAGVQKTNCFKKKLLNSTVSHRLAGYSMYQSISCSWDCHFGFELTAQMAFMAFLYLCPVGVLPTWWKPLTPSPSSSPPIAAYYNKWSSSMGPAPVTQVPSVFPSLLQSVLYSSGSPSGSTGLSAYRFQETSSWWKPPTASPTIACCVPPPTPACPRPGSATGTSGDRM